MHFPYEARMVDKGQDDSRLFDALRIGMHAIELPVMAGSPVDL